MLNRTFMIDTFYLQNELPLFTPNNTKKQLKVSKQEKGSFLAEFSVAEFSEKPS